MYSGDYLEPQQAEAPPLHVSVAEPGTQFQVNFPAAANAGVSRLTYWLTGDEDMSADIELGLGPASGFPENMTGNVGLFVDGVLTPISVAGQATPVITSVLTVGTVAAFSVTLNHTLISDGAHSVAFLCWREDGRQFGGWSFTLLKNAFGFNVPTSTGESPDDRSSGIGVRDARSQALLYGAYTPGADGTGTFVADLASGHQDCPTTLVNMALVGILDDQQIALAGPAGTTVAASVAPRKSLPFSVAGLPTGDGRVHHLSFWAFPAFQQYTEGPVGTASPWYGVPFRLGIGVWGP
jgi:hypothetical protein